MDVTYHHLQQMDQVHCPLVMMMVLVECHHFMIFIARYINYALDAW